MLNIFFWFQCSAKNLRQPSESCFQGQKCLYALLKSISIPQDAKLALWWFCSAQYLQKIKRMTENPSLCFLLCFSSCLPLLIIYTYLYRHLKRLGLYPLNHIGFQYVFSNFCGIFWTQFQCLFHSIDLSMHWRIKTGKFISVECSCLLYHYKAHVKQFLQWPKTFVRVTVIHAPTFCVLREVWPYIHIIFCLYCLLFVYAVKSLWEYQAWLEILSSCREYLSFRYDYAEWELREQAYIVCSLTPWFHNYVKMSLSTWMLTYIQHYALQFSQWAVLSSYMGVKKNRSNLLFFFPQTLEIVGNLETSLFPVCPFAVNVFLSIKLDLFYS